MSYDTNTALRSEFLWKESRATEPDLCNLPGAGAQIKNEEPELSLKFRIGAVDMAIWEEAPAPGSFLNTNDFAK